MRKEFNNYRNAVAWIAQNAFGSADLNLLQHELSFNYETTGTYFIYTIEPE